MIILEMSTPRLHSQHDRVHDFKEFDLEIKYFWPDQIKQNKNNLLVLVLGGKYLCSHISLIILKKGSFFGK